MKPIPIATVYVQNWANNNHSSVLSKPQTINSSVKSTVIFSFLKLTCIKTSPRKQVWTSKALTFSTAANNTIPYPTKPEFLKHRQERSNFWSQTIPTLFCWTLMFRAWLFAAMSPPGPCLALAGDWEWLGSCGKGCCQPGGQSSQPS